MRINLSPEDLAEIRCALNGHAAELDEMQRELGERRDGDGLDHVEQHQSRVAALLERIIAAEHAAAAQPPMSTAAAYHLRAVAYAAIAHLHGQIEDDTQPDALILHRIKALDAGIRALHLLERPAT